jgi:hypothetical protein
MNAKVYRLVLTLVGAIVSLGCDDQPVTGLRDEDPAEHACEQRTNDGTSLTAGSTPSEATALELSQEPYTITLPVAATEGTYAGYLRLQGPVNSLLFAGTEAVVSELGFGVSGDDELPEAAPNQLCPSDIPVHFDLELVSDGDYLLRLGPAALESVWLMYVSAEGHDHLE